MADYDRLFMAEELCLDGSNFIEWYLLLCEVLHANDLLDVQEEPIGDKPNASATEEEHIEWLRQEARADLVHPSTSALVSEFFLKIILFCFKKSQIYSVNKYTCIEYPCKV